MSALGYIPLVGTITYVAMLAMGLLYVAIKKNLVGSLVGMYGLRTVLTLVPPLLFAIDVITTVAQVRINKKQLKMLAKSHY